jgi:hypothetical protein
MGSVYERLQQEGRNRTELRNASFRNLNILSGQKSRRSDLNKYEKAFVEHIAQLNISGPSFAALAREALEAEYGGEIDNVLNGLKQQTLENPEKFAAELSMSFGTQAMQY